MKFPNQTYSVLGRSIAIDIMDILNEEEVAIKSDFAGVFNYGRLNLALNELLENGLIECNTVTNRNNKYGYTLTEKGADFLWQYHHMGKQFGLSRDLKDVCPKCGEIGLTWCADYYYGDSGCKHKGWFMYCDKCNCQSGWWHSLAECRKRMI